jgi:2-keto-4-pentenoate hydratase
VDQKTIRNWLRSSGTSSETPSDPARLPARAELEAIAAVATALPARAWPGRATRSRPVRDDAMTRIMAVVPALELARQVIEAATHLRRGPPGSLSSTF